MPSGTDGNKTTNPPDPALPDSELPDPALPDPALPDPELLTQLRDLAARTPVGSRAEFTFPADLSAAWRTDLAVGAGFSRSTGTPSDLVREWTLADTVAPNLKLLVVGLNPSPASADANIGFARPGNRFWPAMLHAGVVTKDRDPQHALEAHGVGMTDLVKRTTRRASELTPDEFRAGTDRVTRLVNWLQPRALLFVGLAGWRSAVDRKAVAGWQAKPLGSRPVYLMPSTSGLNASSQMPDFLHHLEAVLLGP